MRVLWELRARLASVMFRRREDREFEEEMAFHLDAAIEANLRRGLNPVEARRRAVLALGGVERIKEEVRDARGTRWFEDLVRDLRLAGRRLATQRGYSVPTAITISLGIGVATAVFGMVNAILLQPLPYDNADDLVGVGHVVPGSDVAVTGLSPGTFLHYRDHNRAFDHIGVYLEDARTLTDAGAPEQVRVALVSSEVFKVLGVVPSQGRLPGAEASEAASLPGVLISHDLWVRRYGADKNIVGRPIEIDRDERIVTGVAPPNFHFPHQETHVWATSEMENILARFGARASIGGLYLKGVARLKDDVSRAAAFEDFRGLIRALPGAFADVTVAELDQTGLGPAITPFKDVIVGDGRVALLLLSAAAAFLFLTTCANITNLSLLRAERQRREVALERALGATDSRLFQRCLSEGAVLALLGGVFGFVFATIALHIKFGFEAAQVPRSAEVGMDLWVAGFALLLMILTSFLIGCVAFLTVHAERPGLRMALSSTVTASRPKQAGRRFLVVTQVALALTLLIGSALMVESYARLADIDLGFDSRSSVTFLLPLPADPYRDHRASADLHRDMLASIRALPGIEMAEAATTAAFPLTPVPDQYHDRVALDNQTSTDTTVAPRAVFSFATPGYFGAMGIPLLQGRTFQETVPGLPTAIVSASLAKDLASGEALVGKRVRSTHTGLTYEVIGIVGDVPSQGIREGASNVLYLANAVPRNAAVSDNDQTVVLRHEQYVVRTTLSPLTVVPAIRESINSIDPKLLMSQVGTLDELVSNALARDRQLMLLLVVSASTALLLGLVGIYGVLAYAVRQRNKELGIRKALGAGKRGVVVMVVGQGARLALIGIGAGLAAAFGLTRFLDNVLYEVPSTDVRVFVGGAMVVFVVSVFASYVPARRAGLIDPVRALNAE